MAGGYLFHYLYFCSGYVFVAITAAEVAFMYFTETSAHWFVVGYTLEIGATHYAYELVWHLYGTFLYDLIVACDTERDVGSYGRELV